MLLRTPYLELFDFDISDIQAELEHINPSTWTSWDYRQKRFSIVHKDTESIPFLWSIHWNRSIKVSPTKFNENTTIWNSIKPIVLLLEQYYSGKCITALLAKLNAGGVIPPHKDSTDRLELVHRCHVPIILPKKVDFLVRDTLVPFKIGTVYEISNQDLHSVTNKSSEDRVHLIIDILPNSYLEKESNVSDF